MLLLWIISAIPSETVDGQPQSYMLVTVDESGNLTPLNNDALMSLDPSLGVGGDINNVVLQVDQTQGTIAAVKPTMESTLSTTASKENWATVRTKFWLNSLSGKIIVFCIGRGKIEAFGAQRKPARTEVEYYGTAKACCTIHHSGTAGGDWWRYSSRR